MSVCLFLRFGDIGLLASVGVSKAGCISQAVAVSTTGTRVPLQLLKEEIGWEEVAGSQDAELNSIRNLVAVVLERRQEIAKTLIPKLCAKVPASAGTNSQCCECTRDTAISAGHHAKDY